MSNIDFVELANYCVSRHKDSLNAEYQRYVDTLFVAISSDNKLKCSIALNTWRQEQRVITHQF